ncbi:hypothetical protein SLA2020_376140 [Shorea laevis]
MANPKRNSYSNENPFQTQTSSSLSSLTHFLKKSQAFPFLLSTLLLLTWLLNPITLVLNFGVKGGAVSCASIHLSEIRPGGVRGNHRHYTCNDTFVIWGVKTKLRLENHQIADKGYAKAIIDQDEVTIGTSTRGAAHALVNIYSLHMVVNTFFIRYQDITINHNSDFNVWKDL